MNFFELHAPVGTSVTIQLEKPHSIDCFGWTLAYVFLPDGTCLNELMIKEGFAKPYSRYYCEALAEFQQINIFAKSNQKGLYQTVNDF